MCLEGSSDSSVQFVEDHKEQSFMPQHASAEDYAVTRVEIQRSGGTRLYNATPGTQAGVQIDIEVQHANFSYDLNVRVELRSVAYSNSNESKSHGTQERPIYIETPYITFVVFTLSNDSDGREYFLKISVLLSDDSWVIIYDEKDSSFPNGRLSTKNPMTVDTDNDGLSDAKEIELETDFLDNNDTDNDGLTDGSEVHNHSTDPLDIDTDGDGLTDSYEVDLGTDPADKDTNNDSLWDNYELDTGTDPLVIDTDNAGLNDSYEVDLGTDPQHWDTDGDYLSDGDEVDVGRDPKVSDGDYLSDGDEVDVGRDPKVSDGDYLSDGDEVDVGRDPKVSDGDTLNYGSLTLFLGIFAVTFFIVTVTRRGAKR